MGRRCGASAPEPRPSHDAPDRKRHLFWLTSLENAWFGNQGRPQAASSEGSCLSGDTLPIAKRSRGNRSQDASRHLRLSASSGSRAPQEAPERRNYRVGHRSFRILAERSSSLVLADQFLRPIRANSTASDVLARRRLARCRPDERQRQQDGPCHRRSRARSHHATPLHGACVDVPSNHRGEGVQTSANSSGTQRRWAVARRASWSLFCQSV